MPRMETQEGVFICVVVWKSTSSPDRVPLPSLCNRCASRSSPWSASYPRAQEKGRQWWWQRRSTCLPRWAPPPPLLSHDYRRPPSSLSFPLLLLVSRGLCGAPVSVRGPLARPPGGLRRGRRRGRRRVLGPLPPAAGRRSRVLGAPPHVCGRPTPSQKVRPAGHSLPPLEHC